MSPRIASGAGPRQHQLAVRCVLCLLSKHSSVQGGPTKGLLDFRMVAGHTSVVFLLTLYRFRLL